MKEYEYNDHGVCINPDIIYHHIKPNDLAWCYIELSVAQFPNGQWANGVSHLGGGYKASESGAVFDTRERAESMARQRIEFLFSLGYNSSMYSESTWNYHRDRYFKNESQLTLF